MGKIFVFLIGLSFAINASAKELKLLFGSCLSQKKDTSILESLISEGADYVYFLGDVPYSDYKAHGTSLKALVTAIDDIKKDENFNKLLSSTSVNAIWDDHDYGVPDGGKENPFKQEAELLFLDLFQVPAEDDRRKRAGVYFSQVHKLGSKVIKVIALDTRSFRDPLLLGTKKKRYQADFENPDKSFLGEEQWQWLIEELKQSVDMLLVLSSVQVIPMGHSFEKWGNLPYERRSLLKLMDASNAKSKYIFSGDRHFSSSYTWQACHHCEPIHEFTVSGLNKVLSKNIPDEADYFQSMEVIREANYLEFTIKQNSIGELVPHFVFKNKVGDSIKYLDF
jgi:alkaline phosphatase D